MEAIQTVHDRRAEPDRVRPRPRPPGALTSALFHDACTGCGDCAAVCPSGAIAMDRDGCPVIRPGRLCTHCGLCSDVCSRDAIRLTPRTRAGLARLVASERGGP